MAFKLPELNYSYDALEPHIDKLTMETHHSKHHQGYVDNLNKAIEGYKDLENKSIEELLQSLDSIPEDIRTKVRNNGGGHYNHSMFWEIMSPDGSRKPVGELAEKIESELQGFEKFKEKFKEAATGRFGSGWAWLILSKDGKLKIVSTPNQDNPISDNEKVIFGLDVWEHAYYLKYLNKRADYIDSWWNVLDWNKIEEMYQKIK